MELDTMYRSSENQLSRALHEASGTIVNTAQLAELVKDAKRLPELRVSYGGLHTCINQYPLYPFRELRYLDNVR